MSPRVKKCKSSASPNEEFLRQLHGCYLSLQNKMAKEYKRDLPCFELFFDRRQRAQYLNFGKNTSIYHNSYVYGDVKVGKNTWIGPFTILDGTGGLTIGDFCNISAGVHIYTHDSIDWVLTGGKKKYKYAKVKIGNRCYIGPGVVISEGINLGACCVVGTLSYVNKSFAPNSVICGIPAKVIGKVTIDKKNRVKLVYRK